MCCLYLFVAVVHDISVLFSLCYDFPGTPSQFDPVFVDLISLLWATSISVRQFHCEKSHLGGHSAIAFASAFG